MATTYATDVAGFGTSPTRKVSGGVQGGRMRRFRAVVTLAAQASGDDIVLARIPVGYTFSHGMSNASATLGATATVAIGSVGATGKYRAAAVHTATVPTLFGVVAAAAAANPSTAIETVLLTIAAAALPGSGTLVVDLFFSAP